jgi:hypothetical protein
VASLYFAPNFDFYLAASSFHWMVPLLIFRINDSAIQGNSIRLVALCQQPDRDVLLRDLPFPPVLYLASPWRAGIALASTQDPTAGCDAGGGADYPLSRDRSTDDQAWKPVGECNRITRNHVSNYNPRVSLSWNLKKRKSEQA